MIVENKIRGSNKFIVLHLFFNKTLYKKTIKLNLKNNNINRKTVGTITDFIISIN